MPLAASATVATCRRLPHTNWVTRWGLVTPPIQLRRCSLMLTLMVVALLSERTILQASRLSIPVKLAAAGLCQLLPIHLCPAPASVPPIHKPFLPPAARRLIPGALLQELCLPG